MTETIINKANPELFETITAGDRIEFFHNGLDQWGTVVEFTPIYRPSIAGDLTCLEADAVIYVRHARTYDSWGWPKDVEATIRTRLRKHSSCDIRWAYTPAAGRRPARR